MRNMTASTTPHARLQPIMPTSSRRMSSRAAVAALSVPVNVSAMMRPKRISETRDTGSRTRLDPADSACMTRAHPLLRSNGVCGGLRPAGHGFPQFDHLLRRARRKEVHQSRDDAGPPGLMTGAEAGAVVAVEVLVEEDEIPPVRIVLELLRAAVDGATAIFVLQE